MRGWGWIIVALGLVMAAPGTAAAKRLEAVRLQGLALVREPGNMGGMIRALRAGETVAVLGRDGDWVEVVAGDETHGWVHGGFLTGFADIAPLTAYAGRIDPNVVRPPQEETASGERAAGPVAGSPWPGPAAATRPAAMPVTVANGLDRSMAGLVQPAAFSPEEKNLLDDFNDRKNRYSIVVHLSERKLYLYENLPNGSRHLERTYVVAVPGRDMEAPQGWGVVTEIEFDPWWRPTPAMKERAKKKGKPLPEFTKPGEKDNPMGPFKIILSHGYGYRIHGNNNPGSIGRPVTSGCIRMRNDEGKALAKRIDVGTEVLFLE